MIVQGRNGEFHVFPHSDLISEAMRSYGEWAQLELDFLAEFVGRGDMVVDAGAFIGSHARAFSEMVGPDGCVYAFEPNPTSFQLLSANAQAARSRNIRAINVGLGREAATCSFASENGEDTNLGAMTLDRAAISGQIRVRRLDDCDIPRVDFIKIDVEGMELEVLLGAPELLTRCRPKIFAECNSINHGCKLLEWARQNGFEAWGVLSPAFNRNNFSGLKENHFGNAAEAGLLLLDVPDSEAFTKYLNAWNAAPMQDEDDIALLMLHKPQYRGEVQSRIPSAAILGLSYPTELASSLSSALSESEAGRARDAAVTAAHVRGLESEIRALREGLSRAECLSEERLTLIGSITERLRETEERFAFEERRSAARLTQAEDLQRVLDEVEAAFEQEQARSVERLRYAEELQRELTRTQAAFAAEEARSVERLQYAEELQRELTKTQAAFAAEEARSVGRLEQAQALRAELDALHEAFAREEARSIQRLSEAEALNTELKRVQEAFAAEAVRSIQRLSEAETLGAELVRVQEAFALEEKRSIERLRAVESLDAEVSRLKAALGFEQERSAQLLSWGQELQQDVARVEKDLGLAKAEVAAAMASLLEQQRIAADQLEQIGLLEQHLSDLSSLFEIELEEKTAAIFAGDEQLTTLADRCAVLEAEKAALQSRVRDLENRGFRDQLRSLIRRRLAR